MLITPSKFFKTFTIERRTGSSLNSRGRQVSNYQEVGTLLGVLADIQQVSAFEQFKLQQFQHPVSHVVIQKKAPIAKKNDRLILDGRVFDVHGAINPAEMGLWTIYYCEERLDTV